MELSDHMLKHFSNEKTKDGEEIADNGFIVHDT